MPPTPIIHRALQELMEYEMPRNMGSRDYEKKLELSNSELESAHKEVDFYYLILNHCVFINSFFYY